MGLTKIRKWIMSGAFLILGFASNLLHAGEISGSVFLQDSELAVEGAVISVQDRDLRVVSDRDGNFRLPNLPPGEYQLEITYAGYETQRRSVVIGDESELSPLKVGLSGGTFFEMDALDISVETAFTRAQNIRKDSNGLTEVVSSDDLGEFVDTNVAEALSRVVGVTVEESQGEGNFVNIRGLRSNYNPVTVDGTAVATPEEDGRSVGLNIVSTDQLERIEVNKIWLPTESANTLGGSVNLVTRSALDRGRTFASVSVEYGQYLASENYSDKQDIVFGTVIERENWPKIGIQISANRSLENRASETLDNDGFETELNDMRLVGDPSGFVIDDLALEDFRIERERTGFGGTIEFQITEETRIGLSGNANFVSDDEIRQETEFNFSDRYDGQRTLNQTVIDRATELGVTLETENVGDDLAFNDAVAIGEIAYDPATRLYTLYPSSVSPDKSWRRTVTDDQINNWQLRGETVLPLNIELEAVGYWSEASKEFTRRAVALDSDRVGAIAIVDPDNGYSPIIQPGPGLAVDDPNQYRLSAEDGSASEDQFRSDETRMGLQLDLEHETRIFEKWLLESFIGFAADFREKSFELQPKSYEQFTDPELELTLADSIFFGGNNLGEFFEDHDRSYEFGPFFADNRVEELFDSQGEVELQQTPDDESDDFFDAFVDNYEATEDIQAFYFMQRLEIADWDLTYGLRYERTANEFQNREILTEGDAGFFISPGLWKFLEPEDFSREASTERDYSHVLPALSVRKRMLDDKFQIRTAINQTIARPDFDDLVPREIPGISGSQYSNSVQLANLDLKATESTNYDLIFDYFPDDFQFYSVGIFYKALDGVIFTESRTVDAGEPLATQLASVYRSNFDGSAKNPWSVRRRANTGEGYVYGLEVAARRGFDDLLPGWLQGFGMEGNFSINESGVDLLLEERFGEEVPLFNQSDHFGNFSFFYERAGFFGRVSFQYRSDYLISVLGGDEVNTITDPDKFDLPPDSLDVYEDESFEVDLTFRYRFENGLSLFLEAQNVLNEPRRRYRGTDSLIESVRYTDASYFVGAKYLF